MTATVAMTDLSWMDHGVEELTEAGAFGPGSRYLSFNLDSQHTEHNQFASTVLYGTVTVSNDRPTARILEIVIKLKHRRPELREWFMADAQFHNEILFYENILPFLLACKPTAGGDHTPPACRYFYGRNDCGDHVTRDMIVLENATIHGYQSPMSGHRLHLDFDHLSVALQTLAKFHALSYRAKYVNRAKFMDMMAMVEETHWCDDGEWIIRDDGLLSLFSIILDRLAERHGGEDDDRTLRFRAELLGDVKRTLRNVMEPVEPMGVLCHGDLNRNNMFFLYDDNGRPTETLAFDMATVRYASPALDLSFFLYMNTDRRTRDAHWDELLDTYCAALSAALSDIADVIWVPDRKQLDAEIRERGFYGLAHVTFFVRMMMEENKSIDIMQLIGLTGDNMSKMFISFGGDKATDVIADIVQHFINIRYPDMG